MSLYIGITAFGWEKVKGASSFTYYVILIKRLFQLLTYTEVTILSCERCTFLLFRGQVLVGAQQNVLRLDVTMYYSKFSVQVSETSHTIPNYFDNVFLTNKLFTFSV